MLSLTMIALVAALPGGTNSQVSWGKPGVDFDTYRAEAVLCGRLGAGLDVSKTPEAAVLILATRQLETVDEVGVPNSGNNVRDEIPVGGVAFDGTLDQTYNPEIARSIEQANRMARIVQGARVDVQIKGVGARMQSTVEACLVDHGYRRFRLTADQQRRLSKLRSGSPERHAFLFSLARDPAVLAKQAID